MSFGFFFFFFPFSFNLQRKALGDFVSGGGGERRRIRTRVLRMSTLDEMTNDDAGVGGGVKDMYGEDTATEDHPITPWTVTVARWLFI